MRANLIKIQPVKKFHKFKTKVAEWLQRILYFIGDGLEIENHFLEVRKMIKMPQRN